VVVQPVRDVFVLPVCRLVRGSMVVGGVGMGLR